MRSFDLRQRYLVLLTTLLFTSVTLHVSLPSKLPQTFHGLSTNPKPTLESLATTWSNSPPQTPLHTAYHKLSRCPQTTDLSALRKTISQTNRNIQYPFVVCLSRPVSRSYLHLIQKLSLRLGPPFITTTDALLISELSYRNITPILPDSPDDSLYAMSTATSLLVQGTFGCAVGARLAKGVVYYTDDFLALVSGIGYEWLPDNGARLDGFDRGNRAVLAGLGRAHESCCVFQNGLCQPLANGCHAVVMGNIKDSLECRITKVCNNGVCPKWKDVAKKSVPDVLVMDIAGKELAVLHELSVTDNKLLPRQIVARVRVWAEKSLGEGWVKARGGWVVRRTDISALVAELRKKGFRLVHWVDDLDCEYCAFVTFLRD